LNVFRDGAIKIIHADPPYANYRHQGDGRYCGGALLGAETDAASATEAITVTVDLLREWGPKIAAGGVLLLWQAAGPLRKPIGAAVEQYGWAVENVVVWNKGNVQPGNFEKPYSTQCEWLWILKRCGDNLINHDNSARGDILSFPQPHPVAGVLHRHHAFEKPEALMAFLIGKHSYEGEMVFDAFGCTGSACVVAQKLNRRWVYAESNLENYQIGLRRLNSAGAMTTSAAG